MPGSAFASTFDGDKGGRITSSLEEWTYDPEPNEPSGWDPGSKTYYYESDRGDQIAVWSETYGWAFSGTGGNEYETAELETEHRSYSRSYHSADGQLRVHQVNRDSLDYRNYEYPDWTIGYGDPWGVYEEYWYDALGRRILKRIRQTSSICSHQDRCQSAIERYVWDGDQILWEVRGTGSLDDDDPTGSAYTGQTGNVGYVHGHRIDAPLGMVRNGAAIFLQTNWKGEYTSATDTAGSAVANDVAWPGYEWTVGGRRIDPWEVHTWVGSLPLGQQDQTGMTYRRNRYYDPESGQFTQQDPIGIAGGLNLYGYANGDPVNFSDPFGLCGRPVEGGDTIQVVLTVVCPDGSEETHLIEATRVTDRADIEALLDVARDLTGGSPGYSPDMVRSAIQDVTEDGQVYRFPIHHAGGFVLSGGWAYPGRVGFRDDLWNEFRRGVRDPERGCRAVAHEGVHLLQYSQGWTVADARSSAGEAMAYAVRFGC